MNIFVLDNNPKKCAEYHNDKHVVKMILETAQLLCGTHHIIGTSNVPYKLSHKNHPCSIWVRESIDNYIWLCDLGVYLCREYTHRYNKTHKTQAVIEWCIKNIPCGLKTGKTPFKLAMPDCYKTNSPVQSYRNYYLGDKKSFSKWTNRDVPYWFS